MESTTKSAKMLNYEEMVCIIKANATTHWKAPSTPRFVEGPVCDEEKALVTCFVSRFSSEKLNFVLKDIVHSGDKWKKVWDELTKHGFGNGLNRGPNQTIRRQIYASSKGLIRY